LFFYVILKNPQAVMRLILILPLCFASLFAAAQVDLIRAQKRLAKQTSTVLQYQQPSEEQGRKIIVLEMPFASAEFTQPEMLLALKGKLVEHVDLVYTTFRQSPTFDQFGLNGKRLQNLFKRCPETFSNQMTTWNLVGQTGVANPEEGRQFFHGFVIVYREEMSAEFLLSELTYLDSLFEKPTTGSGVKTEDGDGKEYVYVVGGIRIVSKKYRIPEDSLRFYVKPKGENHSVRNAVYADTTFENIVVWEYSQGHKGKRMIRYSDLNGTAFVGGADVDVANVSFSDSVVLAVLKRNRWNNMIMVCDVTGSMSPYTASVFLWMQTNWSEGRIQGVTFFNDGNNKSTVQKKIGETGGLYDAYPLSFDSVRRAARMAMSGGSGGDLPENNLEAAIHAQKRFGPSGELIMIADNYASPRDLNLTEKLGLPVHIILCGARVVVNPDYLTLAKKTGGTVHTPTEDILNLADVNEGEYITIGRYNYLYQDGGFIFIE
jgi:hypothetical protein